MLAYRGLDAGMGALVLFGTVQITMCAGAVLSAEQMPRRRWIGAGLAFAGLVWLLWPLGAGAPLLIGAVLMAAAGLGWGIYSLKGRAERDSQAATPANFLLAAPLSLILLPFGGGEMAIGTEGLTLAVISGVVTSGLRYALWYAVLPRISALPRRRRWRS